MTKEFVFLYPLQDIFDFEIRKMGWSWPEGEESFRKEYRRIFNEAVHLRYGLLFLTNLFQIWLRFILEIEE